MSKAHDKYMKKIKRIQLTFRTDRKEDTDFLEYVIELCEGDTSKVSAMIKELAMRAQFK